MPDLVDFILKWLRPEKAKKFASENLMVTLTEHIRIMHSPIGPHLREVCLRKAGVPSKAGG